MGGRKWVWVGVLLALLVGAAAGWVQRDRLRSWYYLRGLARADEAGRDAWVRRVAGLGEPAVEGLLEQLTGDDARAAGNAAAALHHLAHEWGGGDPRTADLAGRAARVRLSPAGRAALLGGMAGWFGPQPPAPGLVAACAGLLGDAAERDRATQEAALELAVVLLRQPAAVEAVPAARALARAALRSPAAATRLRGVRLCLHPGVDQLEQVVALLRDPSADVRRAAVLAVGPAEQVVREEELLAGLHDDDTEVRRLTEAALRGRGLRPEHLELGRLLTHPRWDMRLRVLDHLGEAGDLDPGLWLRRLSHDSSDPVRAAAVRVMSAQSLVDLTDRIDQMSRSDPSPTVAQLARYYLSRQRPAGSAH